MTRCRRSTSRAAHSMASGTIPLSQINNRLEALIPPRLLSIEQLCVSAIPLDSLATLGTASRVVSPCPTRRRAENAPSCCGRDPCCAPRGRRAADLRRSGFPAPARSCRLWLIKPALVAEFATKNDAIPMIEVGEESLVLLTAGGALRLRPPAGTRMFELVGALGR